MYILQCYTSEIHAQAECGQDIQQLPGLILDLCIWNAFGSKEGSGTDTLQPGPIYGYTHTVSESV